MSVIRTLRRAGGGLGMTLPKLYLSRMGCGVGDLIRVVQPFSDLVLLERADAEQRSASTCQARALIWATEERAFVAMDDAFGGHVPPGPLLCSMCRQWKAERVYVSIAVCSPCRRELASAFGFRRRPQAAEIDVVKG